MHIYFIDLKKMAILLLRYGIMLLCDIVSCRYGIAFFCCGTLSIVFVGFEGCVLSCVWEEDRILTALLIV